MLNYGGLIERLTGESNMGLITHYPAYYNSLSTAERMNRALREFEEIERAMTIHDGIEKWREENGLRQDQGDGTGEEADGSSQ
jgi:hypothetical protein